MLTRLSQPGSISLREAMQRCFEVARYLLVLLLAAAFLTVASVFLLTFLYS